MVASVCAAAAQGLPASAAKSTSTSVLETPVLMEAPARTESTTTPASVLPATEGETATGSWTSVPFGAASMGVLAVEGVGRASLQQLAAAPLASLDPNANISPSPLLWPPERTKMVSSGRRFLWLLDWWHYWWCSVWWSWPWGTSTGKPRGSEENQRLWTTCPAVRGITWSQCPSSKTPTRKSAWK